MVRPNENYRALRPDELHLSPLDQLARNVVGQSALQFGLSVTAKKVEMSLVDAIHPEGYQPMVYGLKDSRLPHSLNPKPFGHIQLPSETEKEQGFDIRIVCDQGTGPQRLERVRYLAASLHESANLRVVVESLDEIVRGKQKEPLQLWTGTNIVTDASFGDNGKGKMADFLAQRADLVVRFNGGPNAGHTIVNEFGEFKLHGIPSGIFTNAVNIIASTAVVNPGSLVREIEMVRQAGVEVTPKNLLISPNTPLIMPWHQNRDKFRALVRGGGDLGTTGQGIGPTYADHTDRVGLRMRDLLAGNLDEVFDREYGFQEAFARLLNHIKSSNTSDFALYDQVFDRGSILEEIRLAGELLAPHIQEVLPIIWRAHDSGQNILGEAAQGALLDLDLGTYPFVTSSHPGVNGFSLGTGINPKGIKRVIGVSKAYATRVGEGPFPTELFDEKGEFLREKGHEYGATTGRPRRCGWLDLVALKYGARIAGINSLAMTKLDILDELPEIKVCVGYEGANHQRYDTLPTADASFFTGLTPIWKSFRGWMRNTAHVRTVSELPGQTKNFIHFIQENLGIPVEFLSVAPERDASIFPRTGLIYA